MTIFLTGLLTCLALIVAIGAQSLFIMRQAIRRDRLMLTLAVCLAGDLVLVFAGTAGVGVVAERAPWVLQVLTWAGVAYLLWFASSSFRSAFARRRAEPSLPAAGPADADEEPRDEEGPAGGPRDEGAGGDGDGGLAVVTTSALDVRLRARERAVTPVHIVVLTALSVSMLNPHAILDTVVMLGTLANSYGADKWVFAAGAVTGSALWFLTLGLGARALAPVLDTPRTWRIVDLVVGVVMVAIAAKLALG
ncbi:MAG: amino acid transporter [Citricoccus sp.]|nr:amino acid transporter [Citricoccus sp. WCRC_4]